MLGQLTIASGMILLTVMIHALGLMALQQVIRREALGARPGRTLRWSARGIAMTLTAVLGVFTLHGIEIWLYALLYWGLGALPDLHTAVYFSTITYGTVGYDDEGLERAWQLVAAIEGINGIILLGWSTAFLVSLGARMTRR